MTCRRERIRAGRRTRAHQRLASVAVRLPSPPRKRALQGEPAAAVTSLLHQIELLSQLFCECYPQNRNPSLQKRKKRAHNQKITHRKKKGEKLIWSRQRRLSLSSSTSREQKQIFRDVQTGRRRKRRRIGGGGIPFSGEKLRRDCTRKPRESLQWFCL